MSEERFDLVVIGSGSAARDGARKAKDEYDANVAIVEHVLWGGSCPNIACKPTKAYVVVADLLHDINELAPEIGIEVGQARATLANVRERKRRLQRPQESWIQLLREQGFATFEATASFLDERTVSVNGSILGAERFLVATGSRTAVPPIEGLDAVDWLDHVSALELTELPASMIVLGGGPVGLEFAQIFARFGSRVTIVQGADRIAPRADAEAAQELAAALAEEGVEILVGTTVTRVARVDNGVVATVAPRDGEGETRELTAERLLLATGRAPNVEELQLERARITVEQRGIVVDERMRTSTDGIWAAGDVNGVAQFTPVAQYQARIAVDDMFTSDGQAADYSALPTAIFTDPELASIGQTQEEARSSGGDIATAVHPLSNVTRAQYVSAKHGLYKLVYERGSRRVLGAHVVARSASDIVQGLAVPLRMGATIDDLAGAHHTYPSWAEGIKAAAERAVGDSKP
jgi:mercuric reductase